MSGSEISNLVDNLHLLTLPSPLWGVHYDPEQDFIAILHISVSCDKVIIDKGVLLSQENSTLKTSVTINDETVDLPNASKIETITDLSSFIDNLHYIKFCLNANVNPKCSKYVFNSKSGLCDYCSFEVFSQSCKDVLTSQPPYEQDANSAINHAQSFLKLEKELFLCSKCEKTFISAEDLEDHMPRHEPPNSRRFKCKLCTKSFTKKYNLLVHLRVHSGERPYVCSTCGKTYATSSNLTTHINSVHCKEKKYPCELCDMRFVYPTLLRVHVRKHTGEKPYMCQICGKVFSKNVHLTVHMRTHTGEKPYSCPCGKSFTTTGNLQMHKRRNHDL